MRVAIMTSKGWVSAERLAEGIGCDLIYAPAKTYDLIIRYGNRRLVPKYIKVLNDIEAVNRCVDRQLFSKTLEKSGVRNPYIVGVEKRKKWKNRYPRYLYSGNGSQQGKGVVIVQSPADKKWLLEMGWRWSVESVMVKTKNEWRVHFVRVNDNDVQFLVQKKIPSVISQFMFLLRNYAIHGYEFKVVEKYNPAVVEEARKAFISCGLDFGAVDVIEDMEGKAWVVDVNSAPGIVRVERVLQFYIDNIVHRLRFEHRLRGGLNAV